MPGFFSRETQSRAKRAAARVGLLRPKHPAKSKTHQKESSIKPFHQAASNSYSSESTTGPSYLVDTAARSGASHYYLDKKSPSPAGIRTKHSSSSSSPRAAHATGIVATSSAVTNSSRQNNDDAVSVISGDGSSDLNQSKRLHEDSINPVTAAVLDGCGGAEDLDDTFYEVVPEEAQVDLPVPTPAAARSQPSNNRQESVRRVINRTTVASAEAVAPRSLNAATFSTPKQVAGKGQTLSDSSAGSTDDDAGHARTRKNPAREKNERQTTHGSRVTDQNDQSHAQRRSLFSRSATVFNLPRSFSYASRKQRSAKQPPSQVPASQESPGSLQPGNSASPPPREDRVPVEPVVSAGTGKLSLTRAEEECQVSQTKPDTTSRRMTFIPRSASAGFKSMIGAVPRSSLLSGTTSSQPANKAGVQPATVPDSRRPDRLAGAMTKGVDRDECPVAPKQEIPGTALHDHGVTLPESDTPVLKIVSQIPRNIPRSASEAPSLTVIERKESTTESIESTKRVPSASAAAAVVAAAASAEGRYNVSPPQHRLIPRSASLFSPRSERSSAHDRLSFGFGRSHGHNAHSSNVPTTSATVGHRQLGAAVAPRHLLPGSKSYGPGQLPSTAEDSDNEDDHLMDHRRIQGSRSAVTASVPTGWPGQSARQSSLVDVKKQKEEQRIAAARQEIHKLDPSDPNFRKRRRTVAVDLVAAFREDEEPTSGPAYGGDSRRVPGEGGGQGFRRNKSNKNKRS